MAKGRPEVLERSQDGSGKVIRRTQQIGSEEPLGSSRGGLPAPPDPPGGLPGGLPAPPDPPGGGFKRKSLKIPPPPPPPRGKGGKKNKKKIKGFRALDTKGA